MNESQWRELGIEPTRDVASIRRAYGRRLKQTRPEEDPAGFARLRAVYEAALRFAGTGQSSPLGTARAQRPKRDDVVAVSPTAIELDARIQRLLTAGNVTEAGGALAAAIDQSALPLELVIALKDRLLAAMIDDRGIGIEALTIWAQRFGWINTARAGAGDVNLLRRLDAKLEAESWLATLLTSASSWRYRLGDEPAAAARLLTGRPDHAAIILPPIPELRLQLGLYYLHRPWIGHRFETAHIERAERMVKKRYPGQLRRALWNLSWIGAAISLCIASSLFFLPVLFRIPYAAIRGFSRPSLAAFASIAVVGLLLSAVLPCSIFFMAAHGPREEEIRVFLGWFGCVAFTVGIKQLFLPGRRDR